MAIWWQRALVLMVFLFGVVMFTSIDPVFAFDKKGSTIDAVIDFMQQTLSLNPVQLSQVSSVLRENYRKVKEVQADGGNGPEVQLRLKSLSEELEADLANYLTQEQMDLWKSKTKVSSGNRDKTLLSGKDSLSVDKKKDKAVKTQPKNDDGVFESGSEKKPLGSGLW